MSLAANRPLLILLTWRTEDTPGWLARLDVRRIWLRSLDIASAERAARRHARHSRQIFADLKAHIRRACGQHRSGCRFFIEEVARQLVDRGILKPDASGLATKVRWDALEIPPTVQGVIASRIDRLPREDKALLQLASVVGPRVSPRLLAAVIESMARRCNCKAGYGRWKFWIFWWSRDGSLPRNMNSPTISFARSPMILILRPQRA